MKPKNENKAGTYPLGLAFHTVLNRESNIGFVCVAWKVN